LDNADHSKKNALPNVNPTTKQKLFFVCFQCILHDFVIKKNWEDNGYERKVR
jgi:hypothetical protein